MIRVLMTSAHPFERASYVLDPGTSGLSWNFTETALTETNLAIAAGYDALCIFVSDRLTASMLTRLKDMGVKMLALRSAGYNHVDIKAAKSLGLKCARVPRYGPESIAEFTLGLLLCLNRKIHRAHNRVREGNFSLEGLVGRRIRGQTIGVVGTGNIGRATAKILSGFGAQLLGYDVAPDSTWASSVNLEYVDFKTLVKTSDVVTLHLPLTPDSKHMFHSDTFALMKPTSLFINTSRGALVETQALVGALKKGQIAGAALDVYEEEEGLFFHDLSGNVIQDDVLMRLTTFPNVLVTSHQAFLTQEALDEIAATSIENIRLWSTGKPIPNAL